MASVGRRVRSWVLPVVAVIVISAGAAAGHGAALQGTGSLPRDVNPESRNRLAAVKRENLDDRGKKAYDAAVAAAGGTLPAVDGIRLHGSGENVRWASKLGRPITELAILVSARAHDQPYEWSLHEMEAVASGLDPAIIDAVRHNRPVAGLGARETAVIESGREIFRTHALSAATYANAIKAFDEPHLVDVFDIMADYAATAARLSAFNQHMPPGWKQFLPLPFELPTDIHADSRSRLSLMPGPSQNPANLYSRTLAPEGTGPQHIARHGRGLQTLEARVGRRTMDLAILVTAREHDSQFEWTTNEPEGVRHGLEPAVIDIVRSRGPLTGLGAKDAALIQFARELFGAHYVKPDTYARAAGQFAEPDLVDLVGLMGQRAADAVMLAAFAQQLPPGTTPLLPVK